MKKESQSKDASLTARLIGLVRQFLPDKKAGVGTVLALSIVPLTIGTGVSIDLGRTLNAKGKLQAALDSAVLSGVKTDTTTRDTYATSLFASQTSGMGITIGPPAFVTNSDKSYSGTVSVTVPMTLMKLAGKNTIDLTIRAKASAPIVDDSCVLTLGNGIPVTTNALTLNGPSNTNLTGCKLRSNASMKCNGHSGNADASYAVGSVDNKCPSPYPNSPSVKDVHKDLASKISPQCGSTSNNLTWSVGGPPPSSPNMITIVSGGITHYHVCGKLTVSGTGILLGNASADSVLVIENGDFVIGNSADVTLTRTTLIFIGSTGSHKLKFPNGAGHAASLHLTPGMDKSNPWVGVGIYQDPKLSSNIDISWGPGANFYGDGVLYFPNADMTMSGNATSAGSNCTKLVTNTLTSNGSVAFSQNNTGCENIGLKQYEILSYLMN